MRGKLKLELQAGGVFMPIFRARLSAMRTLQRGGAVEGGLEDGVRAGKIGQVGGSPAENGDAGLLAELADAMDSKSIIRKDVSVRLR